MPEEDLQRSPLAHRNKRLEEAIRSSALDAVALNPGPALTYLTGLHFHLMERPVVALFRPGTAPALVLPAMEAGKLEGLGYEMNAFPYSENPASWTEAFRKAAASLNLGRTKVGVEPQSLRVLELRFLEEAAPNAVFVSGEACLASLRLQKDDTEIALMREAVDVAQRALLALLPHIVPGVSERELAAELTVQLLRAGSEGELPFPPIVAFGPNSANPHAVPTDRKLREGELILLDWGGSVHGYFSDLTRVYVCGKPEPELARIAEVVEEANSAARAEAGPGIAAGTVDVAARKVIEAAGYGPKFIHRTGHGLGLQAHEEPYIRGDNSQKLEPGMTFTIEPGIYLPGRGGVRIEDDIVITADGAESLSTLPRNLVSLP
jgi:Xaa-Pro dipeptidase